jgi:hypothetical protein
VLESADIPAPVARATAPRQTPIGPLAADSLVGVLVLLSVLWASFGFLIAVALFLGGGLGVRIGAVAVFCMLAAWTATKLSENGSTPVG